MGENEFADRRLRFSQWKQTDYAASVADDPAELQELLAPLVDAGVDMFHPSTRRHHESAYPDADLELSLSGWTKKVTGAPVIAVGSVGLETEFTPGRPGGHIPPAPVDRLLDQYGSGEFDVVAIGRALLADRPGRTGCAMVHSTGSMGMTPRPRWLS